MKPKPQLAIALMAFLISCTTPEKYISLTPTNTSMPTTLPFTMLVPTATTIAQEQPKSFYESFDSESLDSKWKLLEGQPILSVGVLTDRSLTTKDKLTLQTNDIYSNEFTVQFDFNQCGGAGYIQLTIGNQIQFEFLPDLSTNQRINQSGQWAELPKGSIHRCAAHIAILINSPSYIVLNIRNDIVDKILEGKFDENLHGPITLTLTNYASIDSFLITNR